MLKSFFTLVLLVHKDVRLLICAVSPGKNASNEKPLAPGRERDLVLHSFSLSNATSKFMFIYIVETLLLLYSSFMASD